MKNLGQTIRKAKLENKNRQDALQDFLRAYRETPHSTTGVAPNMLLFGFCRSSGLPSMQPTREQVLDAHELAVSNDNMAKQRMQKEYDQRMRVSDSILRPGTIVLLKSNKWSKAAPRWDPNPYTVVECKGSMITATRGDHIITRNSSFFSIYKKRYEDIGASVVFNNSKKTKWIGDDNDANENEPQPAVIIAPQPALIIAPQPAFNLPIQQPIVNDDVPPPLENFDDINISLNDTELELPNDELNSDETVIDQHQTNVSDDDSVSTKSSSPKTIIHETENEEQSTDSTDETPKKRKNRSSRRQDPDYVPPANLNAKNRKRKTSA